MNGNIEQAIEDIRHGRMIILVDSEARENEGDLIIAAEYADAQAVNFMAVHGRGLICVPLDEETAVRLELGPMVRRNTDQFRTNFTVSVDAAHGTTTGISAADRAATIKVLADSTSRPEDLIRPGHIFPLIAAKGGSLRRAGHTEASTDLARLAGLRPVSVICEIMNEDGTMARLPDLQIFAERHGLKIYTIEDLIRYRRAHDTLIRKEVEARIPTDFGEFKVNAYSTTVDDKIHLALIHGDVKGKENVPVRVHSECLTGDVFHSLRCDCGEQLARALSFISRQECGVLLYMRQEGRGIGLLNKLKAYELQDTGLDTVEANEKLGFAADLRDYGIGAQMLSSLGITSMQLLTNNPRKVVGLEGHGLVITGRIPIAVEPGDENRKYLTTKKNRLGHLLDTV
ncbi:MAG TPA: bifunctional 3,4-dihydroxy-2-butanone-4-phosphate synthase/GTP cyclohydrolase II [Leptospiraceae bacterium]|nr:bifunctional 3,4-dihydroxy-2-butanone-4-phosphate synthase/GTP cyclohydrolase II [Leptospirales bacterium]HMU82522.1 bifunctional 3,4-dihydroxy-2-butanone-4-phosphate synthase/GTP cyclohydrolase II [Leptospiraceae bacterium]HMX57319.1 bifunctional 3,4-dihydroxy-2-butanone-4-phosphate synthase/GTP cyclohydrolase II [Leptospiraceae bacterium]HMZ36862.1 bifunctional 3,4-dihydroxy-2-butanone-4-phosphate synthase/GTP cyclohydrolase II [Leptospiraceae bacterium]HNE23436.1 bifunctional 3,4-dihydrox